MAKAALLVALAALITFPVPAALGATAAAASPATGAALGSHNAGAGAGGANSRPASSHRADHLRVLAAADLQPVLPRLIAAFVARARGVAKSTGAAGTSEHSGRTGVAAADRIPERTSIPDSSGTPGASREVTGGSSATSEGTAGRGGNAGDLAAGGGGDVTPDIAIEAIYGSTGKLATQISSGLDADVFLAADESFIDRLAAAGSVDPATRTRYGRGRVALWVPDRLRAFEIAPASSAATSSTTGRRFSLGTSPAGGPTPTLEAAPDTAAHTRSHLPPVSSPRTSAAKPATPGDGEATRPLDVLRDPRVTRLVIANPVHAPYGRAAIAVLADAGLIRRTRPGQWSEMTGGIERFFDIGPLAADKPEFAFVIGENASAAAQMALSSGSVGLIPLSLALTDAMQRGGRHAAIAATTHPPLDQTAIALNGRASPTVLAFLTFLTSPEAWVILQQAGFDPPRP